MVFFRARRGRRVLCCLAAAGLGLWCHAQGGAAPPPARMPSGPVSLPAVPAANPAATANPAPSPAANPAASLGPPPGPAAPGLPAGPPVRPAHERLPTGPSLALEGARAQVFVSNQIGMQGALIREIPVAVRSDWTDPDPEADGRLLKLIATAVPVDRAAWCLVRVQGRIGQRSLSYHRLFDRKEGAVSRFGVQAFHPNGKLAQEESWRGGMVESAAASDATGRLVAEARWSGGQLVVQESHEWKAGRLARTVASDAQDQVVETVDFQYGIDGKIHQTERRWPDGGLERFVFRYGQAGLDSAWSNGSELAQSWRYDGQGRLLKQEDWRGDTLVRRVVNNWAEPSGNLLSSRETTEPAVDRRISEVFDAANQLIQVEETLAGELVARTSQEWDELGNLVLRNVVGPQGDQSWSAEYEDRTLKIERYAKNGIPVKVVSYQENGRIEELYLDGQLRLRAYYQGADKYQEEDIQDGQVYRTRKLQQKR